MAAVWDAINKSGAYHRNYTFRMIYVNSFYVIHYQVIVPFLAIRNKEKGVLDYADEPDHQNR